MPIAAQQSSEEAGMNLKKVDDIFPGILGNTDQFINKQLDI